MSDKIESEAIYRFIYKKIINNPPSASLAHQRTTLFMKILWSELWITYGVALSPLFSYGAI